MKDRRSDPDNNDGPRINDVFEDDNQSIVGTSGSTVAEYDAEKSDLDENLGTNFDENFVACEEGDKYPGSVDLSWSNV